MYEQPIHLTVVYLQLIENILFIGGLNGEFACRRLDDRNNRVHYGIITAHLNGISNHIHITEGLKGGNIFIC